MYAHERGFTLVELAIVMTIMAILAGSLIVGGSAMLERARISTLVSRVTDLAAAARSFKQRYGYFPGDLPNAANWLTTGGGVSPACSYSVSGLIGNGLVDSEIESECALEHLVSAQMITHTERQSDGTYRIDAGIGAGNISLWHLASRRENAIRVTRLPCASVRELDDRLDTQSTTPLSTGHVTAYDESGTVMPTCVAGSGDTPIAAVLIRY